MVNTVAIDVFALMVRYAKQAAEQKLQPHYQAQPTIMRSADPLADANKLAIVVIAQELRAIRQLLEERLPTVSE
jgi:hypothetical protein